MMECSGLLGSFRKVKVITIMDLHPLNNHRWQQYMSEREIGGPSSNKALNCSIIPIISKIEPVNFMIKIDNDMGHHI